MCFPGDRSLHSGGRFSTRRLGKDGESFSDDVPTRKRLRQGRRRAFHLYQACAMGPMLFADILSFFLTRGLKGKKASEELCGDGLRACWWVIEV